MTLFFLGGYDTTSTTIALCCYNLALHLEAQEMLYNEIHDYLVEAEDDLISIEDVTKMAYLTAVINETLRLTPPTTVTEREASKDITLQSGTRTICIKKGDIVSIPIYSLHRNEDSFPDPESFKPERFLHSTFDKHSFLPFGSGPRNCVAKSFALLEVKLALFHLVRRFRFTVCSKTMVTHIDCKLLPNFKNTLFYRYRCSIMHKTTFLCRKIST